MKIKKSISLSRETADRLSRHAAARHTSVSQLITDWVWRTTLPSDLHTEQIPAQVGEERIERKHREQ